MKTTSTLPQYFKVGNFNLKADQYKDENFGDVFKMIQDAMTDSAGKGRFTYICTPGVHCHTSPLFPMGSSQNEYFTFVCLSLFNSFNHKGQA